MGAGPAGLSASVQASRDVVDHLVVSREPPGGLLGAAWRIDNLTGYPGGVRGATLARTLERQARSLRLPVVLGEVSAIVRRAGGFEASLESGLTIECGALIVASGTVPVRWDVPGADGVLAAGRLHRDVRSLPPDLAGSVVAIVGAGDAAFDSALTARARGASVTILIRGALPVAGERLVARAGRRRVLVAPGSVVATVRLAGDRVRLEPAGFEADHLVVCVGRIPDDRLVQAILPGWAPESKVTTPMGGLFVAGDLVAGQDRFIASAMGQGQMAALLARRHLGCARERS